MAHESGSHSVLMWHLSPDRPWAKEIVSGLARHGFAVRRMEQYVGRGEQATALGENKQAGLLLSLKGADSLLLLISPNVPPSDEQLRSLDSSMDQRGVDVIPVILGSGSVPQPLRGRAGVTMAHGEASIGELTQRIEKGRAIDLLDLRSADFENLVEDLLRSEGFDVIAFSRSGDRGYDFLARTPGTDNTPPIEYVVQVKAYRHSRVSVAAVHEIAQKVARAGGGRAVMIVTNGQLTSVAKRTLTDLASLPESPEIRVLDGTQVKYLLLKHPDLVRKYGRSHHERGR
ncbi:restriction endonuclease [Streptomyces typhae]|nr:restriction endonuclease [Streptomyces typhae]